MKRIIAACTIALLGAATIAFAQDLHHASEGRLSIGAIGSTVQQVSEENGARYSEVYRVTPDHTLTLVSRSALSDG